LTAAGAGGLHEPTARGRFLEWAEAFDPRLRRSFAWPFGWIAGAGAYALLLTAVSASYRVAIRPVLALQLTGLLVALAVNAWDLRQGFTPTRRALGHLLVAALFQLALSGMVVFTEPPGCYVLAALPFLGCAQAFTLRPTPRHPYGALAHALGMGTAIALRPDAAGAALLLGVAPLVIGALLASGYIVSGLEEHARALDQYREAIRAQLLAARGAEVEEIGGALERARTLFGRATARLESARQQVDALVEGLAGGAGAESGGQPLRVRVEALLADLRRLASDTDEARELGRRAPRPGLDGEPVGAWAAVARAVSAAAEGFPHVAVSCRAATPRVETAEVVVGGGTQSLDRLLGALLTNACQVNDGRVPRTVEVVVSEAPAVRFLAIEVVDDGPGFPPALLAGPIQPFVSTRSGHAGLGLYTAEHLVRASGGLLRRENRAVGGARVTLFLPEASRA
jgi:signal transduction histidine kinase